MNQLFSQQDSLPSTPNNSIDTLSFKSYRFHPILFFDLGFSAAPVDIQYPFSNGVKEIHYRHNNKIMLGIGFSYRWFSLRIGAAVVGNFKPVSKYGKSNYFDLGVRFSVKSFYSEVNFRYYTNYALLNAYKWDPELSVEFPNDKRKGIDVYNVATKVWYINNKSFKMDGFTGNRGTFNRSIFTWYLGGRLDFYGINNKNGGLLSLQLQDSTNSKTVASAFNAIEFGVLPGVGYATQYKTFHFGVLAGLGPMLQLKSYTVDDKPTGLAGITLRYDFKISFGYNIPRYFVMFHVDVDTKSISFDKLKYFQTFYSFKMQVGYRFKEKLPKKSKKVK